ncbi:late competence protein [Latilactobacillus graminis DSM 20719]|uniref:Late competence protein n=2 Tax=Latilactobacillus graminis TaxID=60519 RepID=A0AA89I5Q4_9LACO|nr:late competence protein [Latilactobacillus graminis DSM 20719]
MAKFERIGPLRCPICGGSMPKIAECSDCIRWQQQYPQQGFINRALFVYNEPMQQYFQQYKGHGDYRLRQVFRGVIRKNCPVKRQTMYVPIPTDPAHLQSRGFNPVIGLYQDCFPLTPLLTKLPTEKNQAQKNRVERLATPQFFEYNLQSRLPMNIRQIILLDDIYTTGRTLWHAQQCLRQQFPMVSIHAITLVH